MFECDNQDVCLLYNYLNGLQRKIAKPITMTNNSQPIGQGIVNFGAMFLTE